ncbi:MAG: shikimate dehydrogenase [Roseinatronobacter sp.]
MIPLAGVIGCPISHSRSPRLHGHWLQTYGLPGHYVPLHVETRDLEHVLRNMPQMGFVGANVTIPHKEAVLHLADDISDTAGRIGAANTLTFRDGRILADNTDAYGFMANLRQAAPDWQPGGAALVLGAGGAARAVVDGLLQAGMDRIWLSNRSRDRAEVLADTFGAKVKVLDWSNRAAALPDIGLLVNTTSLGMSGQAPLDMPLSGLPRKTLVTDIVYVPLMTDLLVQAAARGNQIVDGIGMLLHQAVPGFERWFGKTPEVTEALRRAVLA